LRVNCEGEQTLQGYRLGVNAPANTKAEEPTTVLEDGNQATGEDVLRRLVTCHSEPVLLLYIPDISVQ
jgi:hypothetical protein